MLKNKENTIKKAIIIMLIAIFTLFISCSCVQANSVEYRGDAEGLITTPEDFFLDFGTLLPGDKREDVAYIKNTTNDEIEVFFKTEPLDQNEYYDDIDYSLLEKISLKISLKQTSSSEEKVLYEGNLGAESMSEFISLGEYNKGFDGEFIFKIEVPTSLRNDYTLSRTKVKWVFAVEKIIKEQGEKIDEEPSNTSEVIYESNSETVKEENQNPVKELVNLIKTGDNIYYAVAILIISVLIIISLCIKKNTKEE